MKIEPVFALAPVACEDNLIAVVHDSPQPVLSRSNFVGHRCLSSVKTATCESDHSGRLLLPAESGTGGACGGTSTAGAAAGTNCIVSFGHCQHSGIRRQHVG